MLELRNTFHDFARELEAVGSRTTAKYGAKHHGTDARNLECFRACRTWFWRTGDDGSLQMLEKAGLSVLANNRNGENTGFDGTRAVR